MQGWYIKAAFAFDFRTLSDWLEADGTVVTTHFRKAEQRHLEGAGRSRIFRLRQLDVISLSFISGLHGTAKRFARPFASKTAHFTVLEVVHSYVKHEAHEA